MTRSPNTLWLAVIALHSVACDVLSERSAVPAVVSSAPDSSPLPALGYVNNPPGVNLRILPTATESEILARLPHSLEVEILEDTRSARDSAFKYYRIRAPGGAGGLGVRGRR